MRFPSDDPRHHPDFNGAYLLSCKHSSVGQSWVQLSPPSTLLLLGQRSYSRGHVDDGLKQNLLHQTGRRENEKMGKMAFFFSSHWTAPVRQTAVGKIDD